VVITDSEILRILIISEDQEEIASLRNILDDEFTIDSADASRTALHSISDNRPDLILLSSHLSGVTEFEALTTLLDSGFTHGIPILIIGDADQRSLEERALRIGAADYIPRPVNPTVMRARIGTHTTIIRHKNTIETLGMIDALTGIPNGRMFDARIKDEWRRATRYGTFITLFAIDIDDFKELNSRYGYTRGDRLLSETAKLMSEMLRRPTDMIARIDGDSFGALLADTDAYGARFVAERIRSAVSSADFDDVSTGDKIKLTVSIGSATSVPKKDMYASELIELADKNLHYAKISGKNAVVS
jgi:diguanylate cyclase (GGDEF)-like protein